jgi:hypothetical protein
VSAGPKSDLTSVRLKMARADLHAREVDAMVTDTIGSMGDAIVSERDEDEPSVLVYRVTKVPEINPDLSLVVGDALFNMRSAFDHLAWQLVLLDGGVPTRHTQFPIHASRPTSHGQPRQVTIQPGIDRTDILAALDAVQPYQRTNKWDSQLWVINQLCNRDKHRLLLTVVTALDLDAQQPWWGLPDGVPSPDWVFNVLPLNPGDWVARFDFKGVPAPDHFDPNISLAVALDEADPMHWSRIAESCLMFVTFVKRGGHSSARLSRYTGSMRQEDADHDQEDGYRQHCPRKPLPESGLPQTPNEEPFPLSGSCRAKRIRLEP